MGRLNWRARPKVEILLVAVAIAERWLGMRRRVVEPREEGWDQRQQLRGDGACERAKQAQPRRYHRQEPNHGVTPPGLRGRLHTSN